MRIALINSIVAKRDAISAHVLFHREALVQLGHDVTLFTASTDYPIPHVRITNVSDLLFNRKFLEADLIIWHFGIYYEMFNAIMIGNGRAKQAVVFHNVTPTQFLDETQKLLSKKSFEQCHLIQYADAVCPVSELNASFLREIGISPEKIEVIPLPVDEPVRLSASQKQKSTLEVLYVGRLVRAKGPLDLLRAFFDVAQTDKTLSLKLVGNIAFSSTAYVEELRSAINASGVADRIQIIESPDDEELFRRFREAQILCIPSYHEGFCKPVIEGLRAGCVPVTYDGYNLAFIAGGLGRLVPTGDMKALAAALRDVSRDIKAARQSSTEAVLNVDAGRFSMADYDQAVDRYITQFTSRSITKQIANWLQRVSS